MRPPTVGERQALQQELAGLKADLATTSAKIWDVNCQLEELREHETIVAKQIYEIENDLETDPE